MIQAPLSSEQLGLLSSLAPEGTIIFELGGGALRGAAVQGTGTIAQMRANHALGRAGSLLLGEAYLCAGLVATTLKGEDILSFRFDGDGLARGLSVEARAGGRVRGYLFAQPPEPADSPASSAPPGLPLSFAPPEPSDALRAVTGALAPVSARASPLGSGSLTVSRFSGLEAAPYTGTIDFSGGIAESFSAYYRESEQTASFFAASIRLAERGSEDCAPLIAGAGSFYLQVLPGGGADDLERAVEAAGAAPDLGDWLASRGTAVAWAQAAFGALDLCLLGQAPLTFACDCSRARFASFLRSMETEALRELATEGPFPVKTLCHSCGSSYTFERGDLAALLSEREGR